VAHNGCVEKGNDGPHNAALINEATLSVRVRASPCRRSPSPPPSAGTRPRSPPPLASRHSSRERTREDPVSHVATRFLRFFTKRKSGDGGERGGEGGRGRGRRGRRRRPPVSRPRPTPQKDSVAPEYRNHRRDSFFAAGAFLLRDTFGATHRSMGREARVRCVRTCASRKSYIIGELHQSRCIHVT